MRIVKIIAMFSIMMLVCGLSIAADATPRPTVIIFVSFSMPDESLKMWMHDARLIKAPVVIRGLIDHSFKKTTIALSRLVKDHPGGMQLDPLTFKMFKIDKVPAIVVTDGTCTTNSSCENHYDVLYGDVRLAYALQKIAEQKTERKPIATSALLALRGDNTHG
jgi:conjugal transfer pilus assembly protein TrbC